MKKRKKKFQTFKIEQVFEKDFYGIPILESKEQYGFEGYYNGDITHPDHRPAHQIWIDKKDAEIRIEHYNEIKLRLEKKQ